MPSTFLAGEKECMWRLVELIRRMATLFGERRDGEIRVAIQPQLQKVVATVNSRFGKRGAYFDVYIKVK